MSMDLHAAGWRSMSCVRMQKCMWSLSWCTTKATVTRSLRAADDRISGPTGMLKSVQYVQLTRKLQRTIARERKAAKREADAAVQYELAASLPATLPPPADKAWALPSDQRPRYVGEYVWVTHPQQLQQPRLGMVLAVWQNGCCDIQLLSVTSPAIATPVAVMATSTALVPVNSACSHAVATVAVTSTADRNAAVSTVAMPIAADGYMISAHGLQLVPLGDERTGRLRDPRLGYHGEMGCIRFNPRLWSRIEPASTLGCIS